MIGTGHFGKVWKAECLYDPGHYVAVKRMNKVFLQSNLWVVQNEIEQLFRLDHPNIVSLIEFYNDEQDVFLVMPFVEGESLYDYLTK